MKIVSDNNFKNASISLIGFGTDRLKKKEVKNIVLNTLNNIETSANVYVIEY